MPSVLSFCKISFCKNFWMPGFELSCKLFLPNAHHVEVYPLRLAGLPLLLYLQGAVSETISFCSRQRCVYSYRRRRENSPAQRKMGYSCGPDHSHRTRSFWNGGFPGRIEDGNLT